jgi:hypothetical protein
MSWNGPGTAPSMELIHAGVLTGYTRTPPGCSRVLVTSTLAMCACSCIILNWLGIGMLWPSWRNHCASGSSKNPSGYLRFSGPLQTRSPGSSGSVKGMCLRESSTTTQPPIIARTIFTRCCMKSMWWLQRIAKLRSHSPSSMRF